MATNLEWRHYEKEMKKWLKEILVWQKNNPDKDWLTELTAVTTADAEGGDRPLLPPPKP